MQLAMENTHPSMFAEVFRDLTGVAWSGRLVSGLVNCFNTMKDSTLEDC